MNELTIIEYAKRNFGSSTFDTLCKKLENKKDLTKHQKQLNSFLDEVCIKFNLSKNKITNTTNGEGEK